MKCLEIPFAYSLTTDTHPPTHAIQCYSTDYIRAAAWISSVLWVAVDDNNMRSRRGRLYCELSCVFLCRSAGTSGNSWHRTTTLKMDVV